LAPTIQHALGDGFHGKARARWLKHVAQICKYYLFAIDPEVESIIGRDVEEATDFLVKRADMTSLSAAH
jgi:hypothetical protein